MDKVLNRFVELHREVRAVECKLEDDMIACLLLLSLLESFSVVVTAIESLADEKINIDFVRKRLLDEMIKQDLAKVTTLTTSEVITTAFGAMV